MQDTAPVEDELPLLRTRRSVRLLALPLAVLLTGLALVGFALAWLPADPPWTRPAAAGAGALVVLRGAAVPWLRWLTTVLVLDDGRLSYRTGVLRRRTWDLPLSRVARVVVEQRVRQRVVGTGTLVVEADGDLSPLVVEDVPRVRRVRDAVRAALPDDR